MSQQMNAVLQSIRARGGYAVPQGGGYWADASGQCFDFPNMTQTVYALARRGLLVRRMHRKESWRDTYAVNPRVTTIEVAQPC